MAALTTVRRSVVSTVAVASPQDITLEKEKHVPQIVTPRTDKQLPKTPAENTLMVELAIVVELTLAAHPTYTADRVENPIPA